MQAKTIQEIVILDPGLREFGGHHPGIIEGLTSSSAIAQERLKVTVYANKGSSEELLARLSKDNVKIIPYFKSDFYVYFYSQKKLASFNHYIRTLATEYFEAMSQFNNSSVVFLYHTLNWEHASALSLAITMYQQGDGKRHRHLVFLMYNPYFSNGKGSFSKERYFKFSIGFKTLSKCPEVSLFTAEYELKQSYQGLLSRVIGWHPCGLLSSCHFDEINEYNKEKTDILLYLGDAKENKGFLLLPRLLEELTSSIAGPYNRFIIQYTITNDSKKLAEVDRALQKLEIKDSRILIFREFLTEQDLHQLWLKTRHIVLNYDETTYQYQSSGVLWLAAAYKTKIHLMTNTWLNREAKRLGCDFYYSKNTEQLKNQLCNNEQDMKLKQAEEHFSDEYRQRLFSDLGEWLVMKINPLQGQ